MSGRVDEPDTEISWRKEINRVVDRRRLLFLTHNPNVEAWDSATGKGLWYSQIGGLSSPPETFMLDGKQHMLFTGAAGLYMFVLN